MHIKFDLFKYASYKCSKFIVLPDSSGELPYRPGCRGITLIWAFYYTEAVVRDNLHSHLFNLTIILQDNCLLISNPLQEDLDSDGWGNVCDNCPAVSNPSQKDTDGDEMGDECDDDIDNDGTV